MLFLNYLRSGYEGCKMAIDPIDDDDIPELRNMVMKSLVIEHPAKTFAIKMKQGVFDGEPEELVAAEAEYINIISDLWENHPDENVMVVLSRALQMIVDMKKA